VSRRREASACLRCRETWQRWRETTVDCATGVWRRRVACRCVSPLVVPCSILYSPRGLPRAERG
jgi:hypothetical protein